MTRIIDTLAVYGELSVTNLAMLSRVNHLRCRATVEWLQYAGIVRIGISNNRHTIALTECGLDYARHFAELTRLVTLHGEKYVQNVRPKC